MRITLPTFLASTLRRRRVMLATLAGSALPLLTACGGGSATPGAHGAGHTSTSDPMPSTTQMGDTSGTGAHQADAGKGLLSTEDGYTLKPSSTALTVGKQTISFQILDKDRMPQTAYVEDQTKMLHFYLVRLDLTSYQHLHPTLKNGTWSIEVNPTAPGPYRMYTDFIAKDSAGAEHPLVLSTVLTAPGTYTPVTLPPASSSATADGLTATLTGTVHDPVLMWGDVVGCAAVTLLASRSVDRHQRNSGLVQAVSHSLSSAATAGFGMGPGSPSTAATSPTARPGGRCASRS